MSNLLKRTIFGSIYVLAILAALYLEDKTFYLILFSIFGAIGVWEYSSLTECNRLRPLRTILDAMALVYLFVITFFLSSGVLGSWRYLAPYFFYLGYIVVRSLYSDRHESQTTLARVVLGQLYIGLPLVASNISFGVWSEGAIPALLLLTFVCIWSNDTGAFIFGSSFGKRKLFPSVSPNKSWEGFFGGLLISIIVAVALGSTAFAKHGENLVGLGVLGAIISIASTWGDLFESLLKRNAGVKDSGNVIPGHGGVLDRIDSFLFALPIVLFFYQLIFE